MLTEQLFEVPTFRLVLCDGDGILRITANQTQLVKLSLQSYLSTACIVSISEPDGGATSQINID